MLLKSTEIVTLCSSYMLCLLYTARSIVSCN